MAAADGGTGVPLDQKALRARLEELTAEHRALEDAIEALSGGGDPLQVARLKKRKLVLKDQMRWIENQLTPDIPA
jgi:hypothetical protein